jgi:nucleoside 2-deoxyribosyltransferase
MKIVYVAGPFRSSNPDGSQSAWGIHQNITRAMTVALEVWKLGAAALCPHGNTFCFQNADGIDDRVWLEGDLELLNRCDAVLMTPDWTRSSGARAEHDHAIGRGLPVFYDVRQLAEWLATRAGYEALAAKTA